MSETMTTPEKLASEYARELTKDRTWHDGNDERIALVAFRAGYQAALEGGD